jgi:Putative prokaryotic signal transducing protein
MGYLTGTMTDTGRDLDPSVRLVQVLATPSAPEAEVVRSLLEFEDIPVVVKGMSQGPYRMGVTYLFVPEELQMRAQRVIEAARADGIEAAASEDDAPLRSLSDDGTTR